MENYNEMYHHGVKGQRWGIRRYQNKDGTMTAYGKKRYAKEMAKLEAEKKMLKNKQKTAAQMAKLDKKKQEVDALKKKTESDKDSKTNADKPKSAEKSIKDMTNEELNAKIERLKLEQKYEELLRGPVNNTANNSSNNSNNSSNSSNKDKKEAGKEFAKKYLGDAGKKILWDTSVDLAAQTTKHLLAKGINSAIDAKNSSGDPIDAVFSNNKRK